MSGGIAFVHWGGVASCVVGGLFYFVAWAKGLEARQLERALIVDRLSDLKKVVDLVPLLVAVTGKVVSDCPLECELSGARAVIAEVRWGRGRLCCGAMRCGGGACRVCGWVSGGGGGG